MENKALDTAALALGYTASEELATVSGVIGWTVAAMDMVMGWSGKASAKGIPAAIKVLRETYGYHIMPDGKPRLDPKGNRMKRSAIFDKISTVEALVQHIVKNDKSWVATFQEAVQTGNVQAYESGVVTLGAQIVKSAEGRGLREIKHWLETGKVAAKAAPKDPIAALGGGEGSGSGSGSGSINPPQTKGPKAAPVDAVSLAQFVKFFEANLSDPDVLSDAVLGGMADAIMAEIMRRKEAAPVAAAAAAAAA